jgi:hypothetical protein
MPYKIVYNPQTRKYEQVIQQPAPAVNIQQPQAPAQQAVSGPNTTPVQEQNNLFNTEQIAQQGQEINAQRDQATQAAIQQQDQAGRSYIDQLSDITNRFRNEYTANQEDEAASAERARKVQTINAINDGMSSLANLYFTAQGAPSAKMDSFTTRYQAQYDQAKAKREQLQRELRTQLNESERSLADKNLTLAQQSINSRQQAELQSLAGKEKTQAEVRSAKAKNKEFATKVDADNQDRQLRKENAALDQEVRRDTMLNNAAYRSEMSANRKEQNRINAYDKEVKALERTQGSPVTIPTDTGSYTVGENGLAALMEDVYSDVLNDIDKQHKQIEANKDLSKKEKREQLMSLESERLALTTKYQGMKKDDDKIAFVTQYAGRSEKAMKKISAMSDDYTQKLSKIEDKYFGKKSDPFDISFPYLDVRKKW